MTREEAINMLYGMKADNLNLNDLYTRDKYEALDMAIKALSAEPCEDCISREEVSDYIAEFVNHEYATDRERELVKNIIGGIQHLPSIQPKTGHWIPVSERLPEELKGVLVNCPTNDNIFCAYLEKGAWKIFSPIALEDIKEIVTAWMPLPEPYTAEKE